jgi:hypothetical protein
MASSSPGNAAKQRRPQLLSLADQTVAVGGQSPRRTLARNLAPSDPSRGAADRFSAFFLPPENLLASRFAAVFQTEVFQLNEHTM